jgi:hypothetical protein
VGKPWRRHAEQRQRRRGRAERRHRDRWRVRHDANFGGSTITASSGIDAYIARRQALTSRGVPVRRQRYASRIGMLTDGSTWIVGTFDTAVNVDGVLGNEETPTSTDPMSSW